MQRSDDFLFSLKFKRKYNENINAIKPYSKAHEYGKWKLNMLVVVIQIEIVKIPTQKLKYLLKNFCATMYIPLTANKEQMHPAP